MAQLVALNKPIPRHVLGDLIVRTYAVSGNSGDTLVISQKGVQFVAVQPGSTITGVAFAPGPIPASQSTITITATGAYTNAILMVYSTSG